MKIILSTVVALFLLGCGESKSTSHEVKNEVTPKNEVVKTVVVAEKKVAPKQQKVVVAEKKVTPAKTKETDAKVDGAQLFSACAGCHGVHGEKKALGKSQVIGGWEASTVVTVLKGYKEGTYGGAMKAVMKGQASKLSSAEIDALAKHIATL